MSFRQRLSLDGQWQFQFDAANCSMQAEVPATGPWRAAIVPLPWQAQFDDLRHSSGTGWYRRTFSFDAQPTGAVILHFGAVDYHAAVWVNGQKVGEHEGGYLPFEFEVGAYLRVGENELVVRAIDPSNNRNCWPDFPFSEVPHGKQSWYGPIGGIWQSVWIEARSTVHIQSLHLTPNAITGALEIAAQFHGIPSRAAQVQVRITGPDGAEVTQSTLDANGTGLVQLPLATLALWSPDTPALYTVTAILVEHGQARDEISATCGFRTIEAREGRIYLNGKPLYLRGALDQAYYPETIYTPPSLEFLEDQVHKAKALGLNCLRCHIKIEDPRYYEVADRLGILVWTEIPNWVLLTPVVSQRAKTTFQLMVERDWNHPSIFAWTLVNEDWGTDLMRNAEHRRWLADFYHEAKAIDPTRLIIDNSACNGNFHVAGDLEDYHYYRAIPDHADGWDEWVAEFASRESDWVWAADYTHERRADLPLIVSEFGNWGLPDPARIQENDRDPWWFENGHEWGDGIVYPHGMRERFDFWALGEVFDSFENFTQSHQMHMAHSLAYEIASLRLHPAIGGYVITEFTDVHWECNGLMDMQRNIKHGLDAIFTPINQDRVIVARPLRWSGKPGERVPVEVYTFGIDGIEAHGTIQWQAGGAAGELAAPGGLIEAPLTMVGMEQVHVQWLAADGSRLASHQVELACTVPTISDRLLRVLNNPALAATLQALGYTVTTDADEEDSPDQLWVATHYTAELQAAVQDGAHLLLLAGPEFAQTPTNVRLPVGGVVARAGTIWQGDWATSFSWLKKRGPFAHLPGDPLLEMEYAEIMPDAILAGIPAWMAREQSWAGLALGWIHKPVSLLAKLDYGRGSVIVTTFKLTELTLADNVMAQALFSGLVML